MKILYRVYGHNQYQAGYDNLDSAIAYAEYYARKNFTSSYVVAGHDLTTKLASFN